MMTGEVIVQIGTFLIALLGAVITYILTPYIKTRTTQAQRDNTVFWVGVAVNAAEQIFAGSGLGEKKKKFVLAYLDNKGIDLSEEQLTVLIEAAVFELNSLKS